MCVLGLSVVPGVAVLRYSSGGGVTWQTGMLCDYDAATHELYALMRAHTHSHAHTQTHTHTRTAAAASIHLCVPHRGNSHRKDSAWQVN